MSRVVVEVPDALWARHDVEVIGFVTVRDDHGMVTARHQNDVSILDGHGLVKVARVAVDTLEDKTLRRIDAMVVGFLQQALIGDVVYVVLVGGIARGVSARCLDFDDQDGLGGFILGQNVADISGIGAFAARAASHRSRLDEPDGKFTFCGTAGHAELGISLGGNG